MLSIKKSPLYRLLFFLSSERKVQFSFLIVFFILNGIFESFSIATIIPFISIISFKNDVSSLPVAGKIFTFFGLTDISRSMLLITIMFSFFVILSSLFKLFNLKYTYNLAANLEIDLSKLIFKNNISQSYINYTKRNSSEMISVTLEKVSQTASAFCNFLILLGNIILGTFIIGSLLIINWKVVFFSMIFIAIYYLLIYKKVSDTLYNNGKILSIYSPKRLRLLQEVFLGFRDVIVNGTENFYIDTFSNLDKDYKLKLAKSRFITVFPKYLIEGFLILLLVIIGYKISLSDISVLSLIPLFGTFVYAYQRLLPLMQQIYSTRTYYKSFYASICDVIEELETTKNVNKTIPNKNNLVFKKDIIFKDIFFAYDTSGDYVLKDLNFAINKGDHIGIYGETGSGKSTFIDILIGLLPPSRGEFFIDGVEIYKKKASLSWTSKIAHVSQNIFLKEGTIAENIAFGESLKSINKELLIKASKSAHIYDFIKKNRRGFEARVGERGINLSGGQRQRIAIARALYRDKDILVLDEATSALDHITEAKIIDSLKRNQNLTIFMVSHRLKSLKSCNRVFKVEENKLIEVNNDFFK